MESRSLPTDELAIYLHLARASELRRRPMVRDKLLVLASVAALRLQLDPIAEVCRQRILKHNPGHLLRRWPSVAAALEDDDFRGYLRRVEQHFPRERAEHMLRSLGIEMARERAVYFSDEEYAAALLGISPTAPAREAGPSTAPQASAELADGAKAAGDRARLASGEATATGSRRGHAELTTHASRRARGLVFWLILALVGLVLFLVTRLFGARG